MNANSSGNSDENDPEMVSLRSESQKMANFAKLKAFFGSFDLLPVFCSIADRLKEISDSEIHEPGIPPDQKG